MPPATFPTGWLDGYYFSSALSFLYIPTWVHTLSLHFFLKTIKKLLQE